MSEVRRYDCSGTMCQVEGGDWVCVELLQSAQSELAALREELATTKVELDSLLVRYSNMWDAHDKCAERLTAAEQRNAELIELLRDLVPYLFDWNNRHRSGIRARVDAALKTTEAGVSEAGIPASVFDAAKDSLRMENQRITPARFKCLACGEYHEGSGNLPCQKMSPMSGASE